MGTMSSSAVGSTSSPAQVAQCQATKLRVVRQALVPIIGTGYVANVGGNHVTRGAELSISSHQCLQPFQISRHFFLHNDQATDTETMAKLARYASADMAFGEDAVCLYGPEARHHLEKLQIAFNPDELEHQDSLFVKDQKQVGDGGILHSILEGRKALQEKGHFGDYWVIVSPALYEEAYKNRATPVDAPIYEIQHLLKGFLCSEAVKDRTGVIFSLDRGGISLVVPMDLYLDTSLPKDNEGRPRFRLAEQFRLVIDDPDARTGLK